MLLGCIFAVLVALSSPSLWAAAANTFLFGAVLAFMVRAVSSRVEGVPGGLRVVNFLREVTVPSHDVAWVDGHNGVVICLVDGSEVPCLARGPSVIGDLVPGRRSPVLARRVQEWVSAHPSEDPASRRRTRLRTGSLTAYVVVPLVGAAAGALMWMLVPS